MARFDFIFNTQPSGGYYGKIHANVYSTPNVLVNAAWAAFKITAPDGTVFKNADVAFGVSTPTSIPTVFDVSGFYIGSQFWGGVAMPTDSTGAYMKGIYTIVSYIKRRSALDGSITMSDETITYNYCPITSTSSPHVAKIVRTLNCAEGRLKIDDLTLYTGFTVSLHVLTITPPAVSLLPSVTSSANTLQTNITYTNANYMYGMSANGIKTTAVIPTNFYDSTFNAVEMVTWNTSTNVFVSCASLCSVYACAKKTLNKLEAKRIASGKLSESDMFTHDKIVDRLVLIQTEMLCGGTNIDQYLSELQTIISGVCNCSAISTTPTPFVNSMTV